MGVDKWETADTVDWQIPTDATPNFDTAFVETLSQTIADWAEASVLDDGIRYFSDPVSAVASRSPEELATALQEKYAGAPPAAVVNAFVEDNKIDDVRIDHAWSVAEEPQGGGGVALRMMLSVRTLYLVDDGTAQGWVGVWRGFEIIKSADGGFGVAIPYYYVSDGCVAEEQGRIAISDSDAETGIAMVKLIVDVAPAGTALTHDAVVAYVESNDPRPADQREPDCAA